MDVLKNKVGGISCIQIFFFLFIYIIFFFPNIKACGIGIVSVQKFWKKTYNIDVSDDGSQFDQLFKEGDKFKIGNIEIEVWETPYLISLFFYLFILFFIFFYKAVILLIAFLIIFQIDAFL